MCGIDAHLQQLYLSVCLSVCLSVACTEQYREHVVDITVTVNGHVVGHRQLSYTFSSLNLARQLSTFYARLLDVACQHHHHHQQQQQQQSASETACRTNVLDDLDEALVKAMDGIASQSLFTVYAHDTRNNSHQCLL